MNSLPMKIVVNTRWIPLLFFAQLAITSMITPVTPAYGAGAIPGICGTLFRPLANLIRNQPEKRQVNDFNDLLTGFSQGLELNPSDPSQWAAFEIYRGMKLGDPLTELSPTYKEQVLDILKKYPSLKKEPFRNYLLQTQAKLYPITPESKKFLSSQLKTLGQVKSNLTQIDANLGYWKTILQYEGSNSEFLHFLDQQIPRGFREKLAKKQISVMDGSTLLFSYLKKEHERLKNEGKDVRPISQAIVDLIHGIGFQQPDILNDLKSSDGMISLQAFRRAMDKRDQFAISLGFEDHFNQVLRDYQIAMPTGSESKNGFDQKLSSIEDELFQNSQSDSKKTTKTIRHLSLLESPFRSCLGGSDCSSRTYFSRALDPNYHYFTLTDDDGLSSGQITIVLGQAVSRNKKMVKVAFVDKIQNISNHDLPAMLEGVRQSVAEKGYILSLPEDLGNHNGISNITETREFIKNAIKTDAKQEFQKFRPHSSRYSFPVGFSRATEGLPSQAILPLSYSGIHQGTLLTPANIDQPWKVRKININELISAAYELKNGNEQNHLQYLSTMKSLEKSQIKKDPEFESTIQRWLSDPLEPFQVRKQALIYHWTEDGKPLHELLLFFNSTEQIQILQSLLENRRYKDSILKNKEELNKLMLIARKNSGILEKLINNYTLNKRSFIQPIIKNVLDASDIPNNKASDIIELVKLSLNFMDPKKLLKVQRLLEEVDTKKEIYDKLLLSYLHGFEGDKNLGRALFNYLDSSDPEIRNFGLNLIARAEDPGFSDFRILRALKEIDQIHKNRTDIKSYSQAAKFWLGSEEVDPKLKAIFLHSQLRSPQLPEGPLFKEYQAAIPPAQLPLVIAKINKSNNLNIFQRVVENKKSEKAHSASKILTEEARLESFEFQPYRFPEEGETVRQGSPLDEAGRDQNENPHEVLLTQNFEMQTTPVTQLQWALVMEDNPSRFKRGGTTISIGSRDISIQPNRPVENVTWEDTMIFIQKLNNLDQEYRYRLPTEAEWEYATRAGTEIPYLFESDTRPHQSRFLNRRGLGQTVDVATPDPNINGLYDMHGNVWQWVQDWYTPYRPSFIVDPSGPAKGTHRVLRGGSWNNGSEELRAAIRIKKRPRSADSSTGFRLVRSRIHSQQERSP